MATQRRSEAPSAPTELRQLGDEDLMQLVAAGDARAFEVVYERHCTAVFSLAYRISER
jgi:RNA polymerase sigma-70 factor (ECF subfamily)